MKSLFSIKFTLVVLLLTGCSFSTEAPNWKMKAAKAFGNYQQYYLSGDNALAAVELKKAVFYAKKSANLSTLAGIYLGECALHHAVLIEDDCQDYQQLMPLIEPNHAYFHFIQGQLKPSEVKQLPKQYQANASYAVTKQFELAEKEIYRIEKVSSQLIAGAKMQQELSLDTVRYLIEQASAKGYQKAVIRWLMFLKQTTPSSEESQQIQQKLKVLQSPSI